ncbi:exonuclease SbcCD subunit D [Sporosarcina thermotolerans]|uniref:Nuclease SbcCD subunit D n=1 Tax=Sporosarcina thermotolerans TaxID=633404 RepID=A0AAW9A6G3_9BACL|nr:exonuclease SbcCD subunit D [Sporosarcina thermotolerans]MDW0117121.1 exonuclease SbcCD subunit D [Sporosarcina thermotolerans]WHT47790.1 exonuclease SbcCD subunit D [Sporosarcina thermotolerans]
MKFFHTADWHLGKLVKGVYMTEGQRHVLRQFIDAIKEEKPDVILIAGDLYDRAVPPTDAVTLLDEVLREIVVDLKTPVIAVAGNHDSPSRLDFGSELMRRNGYFIEGRLKHKVKPVVFNDSFGEVHFHLVPYADPSICRQVYEDENIIDFNSAMKRVIQKIEFKEDARHVFVGHAFVTPHGEEEENTSDSERPLAIGGAEYVSAQLFKPFHYTALGHLHQAHHVSNETIRYSGSPMKYSISEENHKKGFYIVEMDGEGNIDVQKRLLAPKHDMRTVEGEMDEILTHPPSDDYVFVKLHDATPVLFPMEKVKSIYPNAMHIERNVGRTAATLERHDSAVQEKPDDMTLFRYFYTQMNDIEPDAETERIFDEVLREVKGGTDV